MAKKSAVKKSGKSFEETLWDVANKLRGSVESSEYKYIVLSLISLPTLRKHSEPLYLNFKKTLVTITYPLASRINDQFRVLKSTYAILLGIVPKNILYHSLKIKLNKQFFKLKIPCISVNTILSTGFLE